jgi:hypothetical protein
MRRFWASAGAVLVLGSSPAPVGAIELLSPPPRARRVPFLYAARAASDVRIADGLASRWACIKERGPQSPKTSVVEAFSKRWIEQLLARYNAEGPEALGDLR